MTTARALSNREKIQADLDKYGVAFEVHGHRVDPIQVVIHSRRADPVAVLRRVVEQISKELGHESMDGFGNDPMRAGDIVDRAMLHVANELEQEAATKPPSGG